MLLLATKVWEQRKLQNQVQFFSGLTYSPNDVKSVGTFVIRSSNIKDNTLVPADNVYVNPDIANSEPVKKDDVIMVVRNGSKSLIGKHALVTRKINNTVIGAFMTGIRSSTPYFLDALLDTVNFKKEIYKNLGATINQITVGNLRKMTFKVPNESEKFKIGNLFKKLNYLLALYERKLKLLSKTKKYFLQKLFVNGDQKHPVIRFREFNDDWKEKKLAQLFKISNETNLDNKLCFSKQDVLSVSDKFGVVNQIKLQGRSFAGNNISKYKVVRNNQIVYTKSPLKDKPYGIIKIVSNIKGIVSPLYIVNNVIGNNAWFIYYYFDLKSRTNNYLKPLVRLGAKHTMNITDKEWLSGKIFISEVIQEQEKIANLLNMIDKLIRLNEQQLRNLEELKKCLLQNMFC